jgi:hypothetical protein
MSAEPERVFSRLGLMITDRRNHQQPTIQATQCLYSWDKAGIISIGESFSTTPSTALCTKIPKSNTKV